MIVYVGFDDTDTIDADRGTGRLARMWAERLPGECRLRGVVRQQLPNLPGIPFTSRNSSACVIIETDDSDIAQELVQSAARHIGEHFIPGSDPGLAVITEGCPESERIMAFGRECTRKIVTQADARKAAGGVHLSGHGGTSDGIIGALAGAGLTMYGWSGRFIEYGGLRDLPRLVTVAELERRNIRVIALERDAMPLPPDDLVDTGGWLRPRLWAGRALLPVELCASGIHMLYTGQSDRDESSVSENRKPSPLSDTAEAGNA